MISTPRSPDNIYPIENLVPSLNVFQGSRTWILTFLNYIKMGLANIIQNRFSKRTQLQVLPHSGGPSITLLWERYGFAFPVKENSGILIRASFK
jgi:hypothetical protein